MRSYLTDQCVTIFPFTQRPDGEETIIANSTNSAILALPSSAVDILMWLAQGQTIGETQSLYEQKYGEIPDIEDFLDLLENEGFVSSKIETPHSADSVASQRIDSPASRPTKAVKRYHFESISQDVARRIFSRPVLLSCGLLSGIGLAMVAFDPSIIPPPQILVFRQNLTLTSLGLYCFIFITVFFHEMAHLVAARAAGVPAQLGISHRLWVLVAQTDMTGIWMASKRQRYLAVLAGPILDVFISSILIVIIFFQHHRWITISPTLILFCQIALFTYLIRLLWQCYLFVRTDFYYVLAIMFNCKNLMEDTETFLQNQCARFIPQIRQVDQSSIPQREMRVIHYYALIWIVGRIAAFLSLFIITIPILAGYYFEIGGFLFGGHAPSSLVAADTTGWIFVAAIPTFLQSAGFILWIRSFYLARRTNHAKQAA